MRKRITARVVLRRLPLSSRAADSLRHLERYDMVVFTSKHAKRFFLQELRERGIKASRGRMHRVGPRAELLALDVAGKRILYPRSALAPSDILARLRARGARVMPLSIYTALPAPLSRAARSALARGDAHEIYFRSPSGVRGLMGQLSSAERRTVRYIRALCIGTTTARAAREAGFRKVVVERI